MGEVQAFKCTSRIPHRHAGILRWGSKSDGNDQVLKLGRASADADAA